MVRKKNRNDCVYRNDGHSGKNNAEHKTPLYGLNAKAFGAGRGGVY
jgi:hypothetical protein